MPQATTGYRYRTPVEPEVQNLAGVRMKRPDRVETRGGTGDTSGGTEPGNGNGAGETRTTGASGTSSGRPPHWG